MWPNNDCISIGCNYLHFICLLTNIKQIRKKQKKKQCSTIGLFSLSIGNANQKCNKKIQVKQNTCSGHFSQSWLWPKAKPNWLSIRARRLRSDRDSRVERIFNSNVERPICFRSERRFGLDLRTLGLRFERSLILIRTKSMPPRIDCKCKHSWPCPYGVRPYFRLSVSNNFRSIHHETHVYTSILPVVAFSLSCSPYHKYHVIASSTIRHLFRPLLCFGSTNE